MFENVGASVVYYNDGASIGLLIFFAFFWIIFAAAGYVLTSFFLMRIFDKAGVQGKWRAWVPVYNGMIFLKLGDLSPWLHLCAANRLGLCALKGGKARVRPMYKPTFL